MIPDPSSIRYLVDPANPTIVMGEFIVNDSTLFSHFVTF